MNYELAKQLKNAGFPQDKPTIGRGDNICEHKVEYLASNTHFRELSGAVYLL